MSDRAQRPRRRPGAVAYALRRVRALVRPPVTIAPAPAALRKDRDVEVAMRDGVILRVNVYRPPGDGPFPALLSAHPYGKDNVPRPRRRGGFALSFQFRIMNQPLPLSISSETGWEAPDPVWWTQHGYAVVNADLRGAGTSDGVGSLMSDDEARDVYDVIEWIGAQPWCSGAVGMLGVSYLAISQYKAAALRPPSLRAICPWEGFTDAYRDFMTPGGVREQGFSRIWQSQTKRVARMGEDLASEREAHPLRDEWWRGLVPDLRAIEVPMLVCASFSDANLHSHGSFRAFERAGSEHRFMYTHRGPKWATFYGEHARQAQLRFFERFVRGREDVAPPPRVRLEVREERTRVSSVREEHEWPLARTAWRELFLADGRTLTREPPRRAGQVGFDLRAGAVAFALTLQRDVELVGPMCLSLWVSLSGADDACVFAGVEKWRGRRWVPFEGSYGYGRDRIATGRLRASLRALDEHESERHRPVHACTRSEPLAAGEVAPLQIALSESATLLRAGETLRLLIAGRELEPRNPLFGHFPAHYARSGRGTCTLHWGPERPAALAVPEIEPELA